MNSWNNFAIFCVTIEYDEHLLNLCVSWVCHTICKEGWKCYVLIRPSHTVEHGLTSLTVCGTLNNMPHAQNTCTVFPWIVAPPRIIAPLNNRAPKVVYTIFSSLSGIALHIEMLMINYRSTRTIWISKILVFSKIDKIFSCKIALEINNGPGYYSRQYSNYLVY